MNVNEIGTRVKRQFGDEAGAQITDSDIIRWVNDATIDIVVNNNLLQMNGSTDSVPNQQTYALPTDMLTLRSITFKGLKLRPYSMEEADNLQITNATNVPSGTPQGYWIFANTLYLWPAPQEAVTKGIVIFYTRVPISATSITDTPEIPVQYHPRIVEYCIAQAAESDDNLAQYQLKMAQFKQGIDSLKDNAEWEERDFYPSITPSPRDYGYGDYGDTW